MIAIENKYGLKYFAGCREDHLGTWFSGIENYADGGGVRTFSKKGLERIFESCGVKEAHFYYPYPDYKFMTSLYSDSYQPRRGELSNNLRNFDRDRMLLFDEKNAFDGIVEDGLFPVFSNSFLAVIGEGFEKRYVKYSNDRAPEYAIRTEIGGPSETALSVRKFPMNQEAAEHIRAMEAACRKLQERYREGKLEINRCRLVEDGEQSYIEFEFVRGTPLSELMDRCLEEEDSEGFQRLFKEYLDRIGYNSEYPAADYDPIFSNILVDGDRWILIDYEWTFGRQVDTRELAFRSVYCYLLEDEKRNKLNLDSILSDLNIDEAEAEEFRKQERNFQDYVSGNRMVLALIREAIGNKVYGLRDYMEKYRKAQSLRRIQIYEDRGNGYREDESRLVSGVYVDEKTAQLELSVDEDVKTIRIDPAFHSCAVKIEELTFNGEDIPLDKKHLLLNGRIAKPSTIIFPTDDPIISVLLEKLPRTGEDKLFIRMEIEFLPLNIAQELSDSVKKIL